MKQPLSAVIITHNEEKNLRECLASLCHLVDELVVVDSSRTDMIQAIARAFGAVIQVKNDWPGLGAQKNGAVSFGKNYW